MPKRISRRRVDINELAALVVEAATKRPNKEERSLISQIMAEMGRKGGRKGGKKSLVSMSPEQRSERALKAARARWNKLKQQ